MNIIACDNPSCPNLTRLMQQKNDAELLDSYHSLKDDYDDLHNRLLSVQELNYELNVHLKEINQAVPDLEARLTRWHESLRNELETELAELKEQDK